MNKIYLKSLSGYLVFNSIIWVLLSLAFGGMTLGNFLLSTCIAVVIHKYFIYKG